MEVALSRPDSDVEIDHPARRYMENRRARPEHRGVEDHRRIGSTLVRSDELDDLVAAGLLLPVAHEADVDGQLAAQLAPPS